MKIFFVFTILCLSLGELSSLFAQSNTHNDSDLSAKSDSLTKVKLRRKSPKSAMIRSLAFPGAGQWYNEQKIKAALVVATQGVLIGLRFHFDNKAKVSEPGSLKRAANIDRRNQTYWIMGAVVLVSMLDAYIDAHLFDFDTGPDLTMKTGVQVETSQVLHASKYVGLSLKVRF
ncbi:MAG: DUF5683 domain-containing protein [bacterium]